MNKTRLILITIIVFASILRFYKLDQVPPSISWDEAAVGYNGWTIANYGRDEYGNFLPLFFRSFMDDKHPVHIYLTAPFVKMFGLNEFATRFPSALFGVLNVILIYFLAKLIFNNELIAILASFFLTISPYNLHFSHFNHEANFALFFFMFGLILFYYSIKKDKKNFPFAILSFGICFITYHPSKILVPIIILILIILYAKKILNYKKELLTSLFIISFFALIIFTNSQLLGIARVKQTSLDPVKVRSTYLYTSTKNEFLGKLNLIVIQYTWHFTPQFLFISGDKNPRLSSQGTGEFYKIDLLFLILGLIYLIYKRSKESTVLLMWAILAPLPSSMASEAPHAARALFMMGSWHLVAALGFYTLINILRNKLIQTVLVFFLISTLLYSLSNYLKYYFGEYPKRYAIEWQYGMKQIVEFVKGHKEYDQVFITDVRSQPYIFFLYYLKTPISEYTNNMIFNNSVSKSYNNVSIFGKYYFGGWDNVESYPSKEILYVLTPSQYDGLRRRDSFDVKKLIRYPNGSDAFYLVSGNL